MARMRSLSRTGSGACADRRKAIACPVRKKTGGRTSPIGGFAPSSQSPVYRVHCFKAYIIYVFFMLTLC
jgi:hypothetical protein